MATVTLGVEMTPELKDLVERAERISSEVRNAAVDLVCSVVRNALSDNPKLSEADLSAMTTGAAKALLVGLSALSPEQPDLAQKFECWCASRSSPVDRAAGAPVDDVLATLQRIESLLLRLSDSGSALRVTAA